MAAQSESLALYISVGGHLVYSVYCVIRYRASLPHEKESKEMNRLLHALLGNPSISLEQGVAHRLQVDIPNILVMLSNMQQHMDKQLDALRVDVLSEVRALKDEVLDLKRRLKRSHGEEQHAVESSDFGSVWASDETEPLEEGEREYYESKESKKFLERRSEQWDSLQHSVLKERHARGANDSVQARQLRSFEHKARLTPAQRRAKEQRRREKERKGGGRA